MVVTTSSGADRAKVADTSHRAPGGATHRREGSPTARATIRNASSVAAASSSIDPAPLPDCSADTPTALLTTAPPRATPSRMAASSTNE
ncbi:hypothetical protein [Lolliginicoccus levis]|uniref:hypothetical protein n=1 Tax=Lolliginicoccus levis TaxID=2919542 RepID=UPI0024201FE9|nr:hypothetical protein [Lolliginicoccus levis]